MSDKHKHKDKDKDRKRRDAGQENEREAKRARHEEHSKRSKEDLEREAHHFRRQERDREKEKDKDKKRKEKEREKTVNLQKARSSENQSASHADEDKKDNSLRKAKSSEILPMPQASVDKKEKKKEKKEKDDKKEGKKDKKEKKEDKKSEKKDAKNDKAERTSSPDNDGKRGPSGGAAEAENQLEKKLKAWQDDELEVESGDEAKQPTNLQTLASVAAKSMGGQAAAPEQAAEPEEVDPLDAFMAELAKSEQEAEKPGSASAQGLGESMGVMEASRIKTITLEEVEALVGLRKEAPAEEPNKKDPADQDAKAGAAAAGIPAASMAGGDLGTSSSGSNSNALGGGAATQLAGTGGSSSSSSRHPQPAGAEQGDDEDEDDKFHAAFIAEIRRLRESESEEFQAAPTFTGARAGYVFKRGPAGLGYYRDTVGAAIDAQRSAAAAAAAAAAPPVPLPSDSVARGSQLKAGETKAGEADSMQEGGGEDADKDGEDESEDSEDEEKMEEDAEGKGQDDKDLTASGAAAPEAPAPVEPADAQAEAAQDPPVKVVETKKEKRRKRREAKEAEARAKEAAAKAKAKEGFGQEDVERMESDPDRSEDSTEEEQESYFDLVKRFTTKKTLPAVDHSTINYITLRKNIYIQVNEITNMKDHEVEDMRHTNGDIRVRGKHCPRPIKSFLQCGLPAKILRIMEKRDYDQPFPIQMQAIPALMCGRDVIGVAQTGSGKTLAYLLPGIRHVLDQPKLEDGDGPIVFVIAPTRELALQIQREANVFCKAVGLVSVCAYGGGPMGEQLSALKKGAHVLVGTPGRLIGVLTTSNGKITNLRRVTFMVLDEADRMFDMGFEPQIGMFLQSTRPDKQVAMFSATLPTHVEALARTVLKRPLEISVGERNTAATNVTQFVEVLEESQKFYRLLQLLGEWHEHGSIIIFVHQQKDVDEMFTELLKYGYPPLALHGGQDQHDRDFTLQDFKDGVSNILIATSVAARGIDVKSMILVVNFKVPDHLEDYIHRIGRTGRAGKPGFAYTFIQPDEADHAQDMVDALRQCNQEVPEKLKKLAEEHQVQVNSGNASKRRRWGGFGGKGFKYDNSEKSRQQKDRAKAKKDLLIGEHVDAEDEEEERKLANDNRETDKKEEKKVEIVGTDPVSTAAGAAQIAAKMQADMAKAASAKVAPPAPLPVPTPVPDVPAAASAPAEATATPAGEPKAAGAAPGSAADKAEGTPAAGSPPAGDTGAATASMPPPSGVPAKAGAKARAAAGRRSVRLTDEEIEEQALKMAEDTLKNLDEEVREKQLPALTLKLKERLKKAEQEKELAAGAPAVPPPPPKFKEQPTPLMQALPLVPGVLGDGTTQPNMITKSMEQLQASLAKPGAGTAHLAEAQAALVTGAGPAAPPGMAMDELEINDYPTIARQKISHKDPLLAIEEMTGAKCQVKGQYFTANQKLPENARRLYVEVVGPTVVSVQKAKQEVRRMMEALSIRTLNIPGVSRAVMGTPGRYDPMVGK